MSARDDKKVAFPEHAQVRMVGNSVSPPPMRAIAAANLEPAYLAERAAA